jgi:hypothetical protein
LETLGGGLQLFFELQKQMNNVWGFHFLWLLKCLNTGLATLPVHYPFSFSGTEVSIAAMELLKDYHWP